MKNKEEQIHKTLQALDDFSPVNAPLGFEERAMAKINQSKKAQWYIRLAVAALIIFSLANVFTVMQFSSATDQSSYLDEAYFTESTISILNLSENE
ncbi:hypothetical protein [Marinoscillum sp.]|uniref:hypothetical protein n=1 Tax=Marinoscillum sp. TaxID=2024838 RepID=UPI003BAAA454